VWHLSCWNIRWSFSSRTLKSAGGTTYVTVGPCFRLFIRGISVIFPLLILPVDLGRHYLQRRGRLAGHEALPLSRNSCLSMAHSAGKGQVEVRRRCTGGQRGNCKYTAPGRSRMLLNCLGVSPGGRRHSFDHHPGPASSGTPRETFLTGCRYCLRYFW
jgi:hypothetical protein